jgi:uncharacterized protein
MYLLATGPDGTDRTVVTSASDLTTASKCEFAFLRALDAKLGKIEAVEEPEDAMLERAARLGDAHENAILETLKATKRVRSIERANPRDADDLQRAIDETKAAFNSNADVVFQAAFFDGNFLGYADFIVRTPTGEWEVQDSKLARSAKVTALLQLAAYAEQMTKIGIAPASTVRLLLGDGSESVHELRDILPVYRNRRAHLDALIRKRVVDEWEVQWGAAGHTACGHCATCEPELEASRDLLLVAGLRLTQRARLIDAGVTTIDLLAGSERPIEGMTEGTLAALRSQARLQLEALPGEAPPLDFHGPGAIASLPLPDAGDIFFDFEGDPLYSEASVGDDETRWGLDYLFGLVEGDGTFRAFWAHDFAEERIALEAFLAYLRERRQQHPNMHVYHYAAYERSHLLSLAARHGVGEDEVDDLLRDSVLVDLYPVVRKALRVGSRSYSLKKIEPLYLEEHRVGDVTTALDSVEEYVKYRELRDTGDAATAATVLAQIAEYNRIDCVSTLKLRDWLLDQAAARGVLPGTVQRAARELREGDESPLSHQLREHAGTPVDPERSADERAFGLASAAVDYYSREKKSYWWGHYARLLTPVDEWADTRDVFIIDEATVEADWHLPPGKRAARRHLLLRGELAPGSKLGPGGTPFIVYDFDGPAFDDRGDPGARPCHDRATVLEVYDDGSVLVEERLVDEPYDELPIALTPPRPISPGRQPAAITEWAQQLLDARPNWPRDAAVDILRRTPPRIRSGTLAPVTTDTVDAAVASLLDLDHSYLAVQGPPGTGKTYTGARVIARLVREHGWKVGVVSQSHDTVENLVREIVAAGVDGQLVGKKPKATGPSGSETWTVLDNGAIGGFVATPGGRVIGGTAWDFANPERIPRGSLDLLVIDEAGQFSLASTIAASVSARNLLLLGDPQQLPQVSQGTHPEPVDGSALGFVSAGHEVLPPELGYFLPESRRMDAALATVVSTLSYEGRLRSHPETEQRELHGVAPGLHPIAVVHEDDATSSPAEAARVLELVEQLLGTPWTDPSRGRVREPLGENDIIVVTPYNAQVGLVRELLAAHPGVRVGTVDRFQGQEAVIAIVSLAASSAAEVPRGLSFLILKNRLNVAISRAQWAAYLVHSPALTDHLPVTPKGVAELSAFIELVS